MTFIAFLRAHTGEVYLNNLVQGKVDVGRALGSSHEWMELWECCSQREHSRPPTVGSPPPASGCAGPWGEALKPSLSQVGYFWDAQAGCKCPTAQLRDQSPHNLLGPQFHPIWALCCAPSALQRAEDKKQGVFRHFSNCFLKACDDAPKGVTLCMHQSRAFWMHQVNDMWILSFFSPLSSSVLKLNWVFWSNCPSLSKEIECLLKTACTFIHPTSGFGKNSVTF